MPPLLNSSGTVNMDVVRMYGDHISNYFSLSNHFTSNNIIVDMIRVTWSSPQSKKILIFFMINLAFFFVEFAWGFWANSLGLISDAFHMLFDCLALMIGLVASYIAQLPVKKNEFQAGYSKIETITGLFNGVFLMFISYDILCESIQRIFEPVKIYDEGLIPISVIGLIINLIGLYFFHDHHGHDHSHNH